MEDRIASVLETTAAAFSLSNDETARLSEAKVPRLIVALPFIAGCPEAERIATSHLATYLLSLRTGVFHATERDNADLFARLERISHFPGGDAALVTKGMSLLVLCMISNYRKDVEDDRKSGKYNPVAAGAFDFETEKSALIEAIGAVSSPEVDAVMTVEDGLRGWWDL